MTALPQSYLLRELRRYRYDRRDADNTGRGRIPIKALADYLGISRKSLFLYMEMGRVPEGRVEILSRAISAISAGKLRFKRHGRQWHVEGEATEVM